LSGPQSRPDFLGAGFFVCWKEQLIRSYAGDSDSFYRLANNSRLQTFDVDGDVGEFGHSTEIYLIELKKDTPGQASSSVAAPMQPYASGSISLEANGCFANTVEASTPKWLDEAGV
jgi:hypothetical protein